MNLEGSKIIPCGAFYLVKNKKSPYWQVRASKVGRDDLFKSTKCSDQKKAKTQAKKLYDEWAQEKKLTPGEKIFYIDLWNEFVEVKETEVKPQTLQRIKQIGELHLLPYFAHKFLGEIQSLWPRWVLAQKKIRPNSPLFNEHKYMSGSLRYAVDRDYLEKMPKIKIAIKKSTIGKCYTDDEISRLLDKAKSKPTLLLQVLMGYTMGMRHGEIAYLSLEHINIQEQTVTILPRKNKSKIRTIRISPEVFPLLKERVESLAKKSPWLFPQKKNPMRVQKMQSRDIAWSNLKRSAGVVGRFHDLRHTCATKLAQSAVPAEIACNYLGMSLKIYDSVYCHLNEHDTASAASVVELPKAITKIRGLDVEKPANG